MNTQHATTVEPRMAAASTTTAGPALAPQDAQPVTLRPAGPPPSTRPDVPAIVQHAMDKGLDFDQIERAIRLADGLEKKAAERAFNQAFAAFKGEAIQIAKSKTVSDGPLKGKKYSGLYDVIEAVTPALSKYGLSHSWKTTRDEPTVIEVTSVLRHVDGHQECNSVSAGPDTGPGRNAIQARGSALSYCARYASLGSFGLASAEEDDDGNKAGPHHGEESSAPPRRRAPEHQAIIDQWKAIIRATTSDAEARREWAGCNAAVKHNPADYDEMYAFTVAHRNFLKEGTKK